VTRSRQVWNSQIVERQELTAEYLLLKFTVPPELSFSPGMFVEISLPQAGFSLPRPFSVISSSSGFLELLVKVVGRETSRLKNCDTDCQLQLFGPLGTSFPEVPGELLLVAGGVGIAPLLFLKSVHTRRTTLLAGFRNSAEYTALASALPGLQSASLSTDDGSAGYHGLVTELLAKHLKESGTRYSAAMVCGPEPMMRAVSHLLHPLPTWVSLESYMACGYGVCMGCVVEMSDGSWSRACSEGPVFRSDQLAGYRSQQ
jgi:dihydroorotate dehydrogenase electron transfer subunit